MMNCIDVNPNNFNENSYIKYNKELANQNKIWNQNLINDRLQNQGFQTFAQELQKPIIKAIEKQTTDLEYEEFVPFTLKLNINKNTFNIPKNVPEIKEITLEKYGPVKEIYQGDLKFLVTKDKNDEVLIYNSKANVKYLFTEELQKCFEGNAFNENDQLIVSKESVENYLNLIENSKSNFYFKKLHTLVEGKPLIYKKKKQEKVENIEIDIADQTSKFKKRKRFFT